MSALSLSSLQSNLPAKSPMFRDNNGLEMGQLCTAWVHMQGTGSIIDSFNTTAVSVSYGSSYYVVNIYHTVLGPHTISVAMNGIGNEVQLPTIASAAPGHIIMLVYPNGTPLPVGGLDSALIHVSIFGGR